MASSSPFVLRLMSSCVAIANRAGRIIRSIVKKGELGVIDKGGDGEFDPQTEADRTAQQCIMASLLKNFPNLEIVGEEQDVDASGVDDDNMIETSLDPEVLLRTCPEKLKSVEEKDVVVWVDPVDGTREFAKDINEYVTVLIGISWKGRPIGGVIHQPFFVNQSTGADDIGRTLWALSGLKPFGFEQIQTPPGRRYITTARLEILDRFMMETIGAMGAEKIIHAGGAGYKVILLLEGTADAYIFASPILSRWDTCACEALLECVGGKLTDVFGNQITYYKLRERGDHSYRNKGGLIASLKEEEHDSFVERIPGSVRNNLR